MEKKTRLDGGGSTQTGLLQKTPGSTLKIIGIIFNHDGYMYVGWRYINNNWYYLNPGDISELPFGAMATGWQSIHSANYGKSFDYYLGPDGNLLDSPSERFISYGHDYTLDGDVKEINTMARAEEVADILTNLYGLKGDLRTNKVASDVFNIDGNIPDGKTYLNTGLFVHNGHGGQGCAIFRSPYSTFWTVDWSRCE